ncbi:MAG TPA: BON domain-containing protein [Burkholderiales bacterium]|nr:BON domain-containing protein [Burkholderiales bacterium]
MRIVLLGMAIAWLAYTFGRAPRREMVPDDVLVTRVRFALDKVLAQPGSVNIEVHDGRVTLTGPVASAELGKLQRTLRGMPGVRGLACRLRAHA